MCDCGGLGCNSSITTGVPSEWEIGGLFKPVGGVDLWGFFKSTSGQRSKTTNLEDDKSMVKCEP